MICWLSSRYIDETQRKEKASQPETGRLLKMTEDRDFGGRLVVPYCEISTTWVKIRNFAFAVHTQDKRKRSIRFRL